MTLPLYADRNIPRRLVEALRTQGFSVFEAVRITPEGTADIDEIRQATRRNAVLISLNYAEAAQWQAWADRVADETTAPVQIILLPSEPAGPRLLVRTRMALRYLEGRSPTDRPNVLLWRDLRREIERARALPGFTVAEVALAAGWRVPPEDTP